ncbi:unnamed protein product [marine sediment metagenome]|uniref:DUF2290 domain-containing protein n=1 Tax=marine sediment metagenome TaxID=412755 RepID=X0Z2M9_9ZZZZ
MNIGKFKNSLDNSANLLKKNGLLRLHYRRNKSLSKKNIEVFGNGNIVDFYKLAIINFDYDILLFDESILQFEFTKFEGDINLRYVYCQFPYDFPTYKTYLKDIGHDYDEVRDKFREDYEQEVNEAELKKICIYIRYDYNPLSYKPIVHAASHLHFGNNNTIRIPISRIISPCSFMLFILKHAYYDQWSSLMRNSNFNSEFLRIKNSCTSLLNSEIFKDLDKKELYLT